jgi:uncharacterized protein
MARVERDSPFSHFPDVERGMMLIEGERLELHVAADPPLAVRASGPAVTFPGDQPTRGVPAAGGIVNLNVMVRRDVMRQRMIRWSLPGQTWVPVATGGKTFLFVQRGQLVAAHDNRMTCDAGDTLVLDAALEITGTAELIEVNIWPA